MTFMHKLSRRLALLFGSAALATLAIYACELPLPLTSPSDAAQLVVSPHAVFADPNQDVMFTAVGLTAEGDTADVDVTWSTTGGSISGQSRSTNGRRHYGHWKNSTCGSFTVTAASNPGGLSDAAGVIVTCVASVAVTPPSATIPQGQTLQLTATPIDTSGAPMTGQAVAWASSNGAVATVTGSGLVSAMAPGLATITATSGGKSGTAAITVTSVPVAAVDVAPAVATIPQGQTTQLTATPKDAAGNPLAGRAVTWASSNGAVATVNNSGLVSALAAGSATITATSEGQSGSAAVTVAPVTVASVAVSPATASIQVGQTAQLTATPKDASGNTLSGRVVNWTSSNNSVATVSSSGLVTGLTAGSATITATSEGQSGSAALTVTAAPVPVASVAVSPATATIPAGQTAQLTATPKDASGNTLTGRTVSWASSNTAVATVSTSGLVTGKVAGSATITATSEGQCGASAVTVAAAPVPVASVAVTPATPSIQVGQTVQLTATPKDASGNTLTGRTVGWTSSNTAVATVSTSGLVTGKVAGSATITATSEGQSGSAAVTVTPVPVASVAVSPATASILVGQTQQLTATPKDASGNTLSGRVVSWQSSNGSIATVRSSGRVTGLTAGSATITATSEGQSGSAGVRVAAAPVPVASVAVTPATASIQAGQTVQLTATPKDASGNTLSGRTVSWASSNTAFATVSASGLVTGKAAGSATITATSEGKSGTAVVTVTQVPVAS